MSPAHRLSRSAARRQLLREKRELRPVIAFTLCCLAFVPLILAAGVHLHSRNDRLPNARLLPAVRASLPSELLVSVRSAGFEEGFCTQLSAPAGGGPAPRPTNFLKSANKAWLALLIPAVLFMFIGLAIVTDDYFVPALEAICKQLHLSEDVAGATFMAAGSSAPELFTSLLAVFWTKDDVGIGTIVGSAVFNILVIIGLSAVLAREVLDLDFRPLMRDSSFYIVSVALLLIFVLGFTPGKAHWWEGLLLVAAYLGYILFMKFGNKPYFRWAARWADRHDHDEGVSGESDTDYGKLNPRSQWRTSIFAILAINHVASASMSEEEEEEPEPEHPRKFLGIELPKSKVGWLMFPMTFPWMLIYSVTIVNCAEENRRRLWPVTFLLSIIWISAISFAMVEGARLAGCYVGIPSAVMGLTFLAAGTSVPDALASVAVARKGQGNMAVSNAIGSNVFDILLGLGLPWLLAGIIFGRPQLITIKPITTVVVPIAILLAIILILIGVLVCLRWKLSRPLGYILASMYIMFLIYAILEALLLK